jgi:4-hydroxybenzoate polyprenyltransferase
MCITRYVVLTDVLEKQGSVTLILSDLLFVLLVVAAIFITAAGNSINDYFDQRVDKINKPEKVIVGKAVNRKHAILIHQGFNALALTLVGFVCFQTSYWTLLILPLIIIFFLWWYSPVFKKKPLIGNLLVACCTAAVPVFGVAADLHFLEPQLQGAFYQGMKLHHYAWLWVLGISMFAFVLTMIREAVKDAQDEPGDRTEQYQTIPILWGLQKTKRYVFIWMLVFLAMASWCISRTTSTVDAIWLLSCLIIPMLISMFYVQKARKPEDFGTVSRWIKVVMLGGLAVTIAVLC